jgi:apolipoprotein D and lipocalin family protein
MKLMNKLKFVFLILPLLASCGGTPDGIEVVDDFELNRYLGTWYEIARLDHRFERGLSSVSANYSMREDGGVKVLNKGVDTDSGEWEEAIGKAYFIGDSDVGQLKVSFFGPFYGGYNIVELDKVGYEYSMVVGPSKKYLWILARDPDLDPEVVKRLVDKAQALGFATEDLIYVSHAETAGD